MKKQEILATLVGLGLNQTEAKVYIFLAHGGPVRARDVVKSLKLSKQRLYPIIKSLQSKGIVSSTLERPARFSAVSFEKILDLFVTAKMEQALRLKRNKDEILSDWQFVARDEGGSLPSRFAVIEGKSYVYSKIQQMIEETENCLSFVATVPSLARADQYGLFDFPFNHPIKSKIKVRFLTEISDRNLNPMKALLNKNSKNDFILEGRIPDLGLKLCPRMVIKDEEETVFFIGEKRGEFATETDDTCLWTDSTSLTHAFLAMFEDLWENSTDIRKKIFEIESDKPPPNTCVISDSQVAKTKYEETLNKTAKEILMMTSSTGLIEFWKKRGLITELARKGVSVKVMAPITGENLDAARDLLKSCKVKHVAPDYLGTIAIDGKYLFQFKTASTTQINRGTSSDFDATFYTDDVEYVEKAKNMLEDIWEQAHMPSDLTIESIIKLTYARVSPQKMRKLDIEKTLDEIKHLTIIKDPEASKTLTEKQVLHRAVSAEKIPAKDLFKEISRMFTTWGWAIIDSPRILNLTKMMISAVHIEKQSSLGEEDTIHVSLWLNTPSGYGFVPVAVVHDRPETALIWKKTYTGTPAEQNIQTVKKDEIQVRVHGNTLFAGWTKPIQLGPIARNIPPSCLMFEGYGRPKPGRGTMITPAGVRNEMEYNSVEAFVTLVHPALKYEGSGTEGIILRDCVIDVFPP